MKMHQVHAGICCHCLGNDLAMASRGMPFETEKAGAHCTRLASCLCEGYLSVCTREVTEVDAEKPGVIAAARRLPSWLGVP